MSYEGEYFKDRDFYDWGLDYEVERLSEDYNRNLDTLKMYRKSYKKIVDDKRIELEYLDPDEKQIVDLYISKASAREINKIYEDTRDDVEIIADYHWYKDIIILESKLGKKTQHELYIIISMYMIEEEELHNSMCLINMYTIIDEFLSEVARAIGVYHSRFVDKVRIRTSYSELREINNDTDMRDYVVKTALLEDKNFTGVINKFTQIIKFFDKRNDDLRSKLALYQIERNGLIHNKGFYKDDDLNKIQDNLKEKYEIVAGKPIKISNERLDECIGLAEEISRFIWNLCSSFYEQRI